MTQDELKIKQQVSDLVRLQADEIGWRHLSIDQKKRYYEIWTADEMIGGRLATVIDAGKIRVYLKDSIIKNYMKDLQPGLERHISQLGVPCSAIAKRFIKPEAILCKDGCLYTICNAKDWKIAVISAFERGHSKDLRSNIVYIFNFHSGRFMDRSFQVLIEDAATRLGVKVIWSE